MRGLAIAAALLALLPLADAAEVVGHLQVGGPVEFEGQTTATAPAPIGAYVSDSSSLTRLHGTWPVATVHFYRETHFEVGTIEQRARLFSMRDEPSWEAHDLELTLATPGTGWVGLHPSGGTLVTTGARLTLAASSGASIGGGSGQPDGSDPSVPYFLVRSEHPALAHAATSWSYSGPGILKIMGPSVVLHSRENTTTFVTGDHDDGLDPTHSTHRWVVIEFHEGGMDAAGAPTAVLASRESVTWSGVARLANASGAVDSAARGWRADGPEPDASLEGDLRAEIAPEGSGIAMDVSGDLRDASLESHLVVPGPTADFGWWPIALVGAAMGGSATWAVAKRRERARGGGAVVGPEQFAELASLAAERGDFAEAAAWAFRAREQSPQSRRAAIDHAYFVAKSGDVARAASILRAPLLRDDPDAALVLVMLLLEHGDVARAAAALIEALRAHPQLIHEVESDPETVRLLARPDVGQAARAASRALERAGADADA